MLVILYRRNESGRAYYYTLDDRQQSLFNPHTLTVSWGLHPEGGRRKTYVFETAEEKNRMIRQLIRRKMRSSYQVLYSYFKEMQERIRTESLLQQSRAVAAGGDAPGREPPRPNRDWARRGG